MQPAVNLIENDEEPPVSQGNCSREITGGTLAVRTTTGIHHQAALLKYRDADAGAGAAADDCRDLRRTPEPADRAAGHSPAPTARAI